MILNHAIRVRFPVAVPIYDTFDIVYNISRSNICISNSSIIKRAQEKELVKINIHNLRNWAKDKHKSVDDKPYGGGPGMLMKIEPNI